MHLCSYAHEYTSLPDEVREALEDESYRAFMGRARESQSDEPPGPETEPRSVPGPLAQTTRRLLATAAFGEYTHGNHSLSERVAHEAVSWCAAQWARLGDTDYLAEEEQALETFVSSGSLDDARGRLHGTERPSVKSLADALLVADHPAGAERPSGTLERAEQRARISLVADRWRSALQAERDAHRTRELGRALGSFVRELRAAIPALARAQSLVRDLFGSDSALWDLSSARWNVTDWDALERYSQSLEEMAELERLAEILGRSRVRTEIRDTAKVVRDVRYRPVGIGKSEVTGVNFGDDLTSLLPSEVALLSDPLTEDLFYAKLAHKEMLQLDYRRERLVRLASERLVATREEVIVPRGPVVLCVDTSGSMLGDPEVVAKAITLALARRIAADKRDIHVVAFSTAIRAITLRAPGIDLADLCAFLGGSFHGGTDLRPALAESIRVLEAGQFENADVLVISDFKVPKIADRFIEAIKAQQRHGTLFHSLTIARAPVKDPLHIFDNSWLFDVSEGMRGISPDTLRFLG